MRLFHLYQTVYSFRGVVFTDSLAVEDFAKKQGLLVMKNVQVNKYGLPFVKNMIARMVTTVPALYYGYCNSDILINPSIFDALMTGKTGLELVLEKLNMKRYEVIK